MEFKCKLTWGNWVKAISWTLILCVVEGIIVMILGTELPMVAHIVLCLFAFQAIDSALWQRVFIKDGQLVVKTGHLHIQRTDLSEIKAIIVPPIKIIQDQVQINYGERLHYVVNPEDKAAFINAMKEAVPGIEIDSNIL